MSFKSIPVVAGKVTGTLSDFPVLIQPSAISGFGSITLAEAQSIRIYTDEAKTTELAREVVAADEIWVKVTSLSTSSVLYVDYDGIRSDYAVTATYGRNNVWSDYAAVWHMEEDPSTTNIVDATGNGIALSSQGSMTSGDSVAGPFGSKAIEFDGVNDALAVTGATSLEPDTSDFTMQCWGKPITAGVGREPVIWKGVDSGSGFGTDWYHMEYDFGGDGKIGWGIDDGSAFDGLRGADISTSYGLNSWNLWHAVRDHGSNMKMFQDGVQIGSVAKTQGDVSPNGTFYIARNYTGDYSNVVVDEVRIRRSILSADWISAEEENMRDNGAFWGTASDIGGAAAQQSNFLAFMGA